jgi:hypothetical protein
MQRFGFIAGTAVWFALVAGCEKKPEATTTIRVIETQAVTPQPVARTATFETDEVRASIDRYSVAPTAENAVEVQKSFAELEVEIAELQEDVLKESDPEDKAEAAVKLRNLSQYRDAERIRFTEAQVKGGAVTSEVQVRDTGHEIKEDLKDVGREIKNELKDIVR